MGAQPLSDGRAERRPTPSPQALVGLLLVAATAAASQLGARYLMVLVAVAVAMSALELAADFHESGLSATPMLYAVGAGAFPVAAYLWQEPGLAGATAALILLVAFRFVLSRPLRGTILSVAAFVLSAFYVGFGASYLLLLRHEPQGARQLLGLLAITLLFHGARWLADIFLGGRPVAAHLPGSPTLVGLVAGVVASLVGVVLFFVLTHHHLRPQSLLAVALAVGAALCISAIGWGLLRPDETPTRRSPAPAYVLAALQGLGLAAPALFYSVRLVLR